MPNTCPKLEQMTATARRIDVTDVSEMKPRKALKLAYMSREYKDRIMIHKRKCPICKANAAPVVTAADVALIPTQDEEAE